MKLTIQSFIVRIYRVDAQDLRKINGLVEALDGSGESEAFVNADELLARLNKKSAEASQKIVLKTKGKD